MRRVAGFALSLASLFLLLVALGFEGVGQHVEVVDGAPVVLDRRALAVGQHARQRLLHQKRPQPGFVSNRFDSADSSPRTQPLRLF